MNPQEKSTHYYPNRKPGTESNCSRSSTSVREVTRTPDLPLRSGFVTQKSKERREFPCPDFRCHPLCHPTLRRWDLKPMFSRKNLYLGTFREWAESPGVTRNKNVIRACGIGTVQHALLKKQQNPREGSAVLIGLRKYGMV